MMLERELQEVKQKNDTLQRAIVTVVSNEDRDAKLLEATVQRLQQENLTLQQANLTLQQANLKLQQANNDLHHEEQRLMRALEGERNAVSVDGNEREAEIERLTRELQICKDERIADADYRQLQHKLSTAALLRGFSEENQRPALWAVEALVLHGADVTTVLHGSDCTMLYHFMNRNEVDLFAACLKTPNSIDWTISLHGGYKNTILHQLFNGGRTWLLIGAMVPRAKDSVETMLRLILLRLAEHGPTTEAPDKVDWGQKDRNGHDCLSWAAYYGHLALFWGLVQEHNVTYFTQHVGPFLITYMVHYEDVIALERMLNVPLKERFVFKAGVGHKLK